MDSPRLISNIWVMFFGRKKRGRQHQVLQTYFGLYRYVLSSYRKSVRLWNCLLYQVATERFMGRSRIAQAYAKCNTQCLYTKMYTCLHNYAQQHKQIFVCVDAIREHPQWCPSKGNSKRGRQHEVLRTYFGLCRYVLSSSRLSVRLWIW